jgi:hypothetical protein
MGLLNTVASATTTTATLAAASKALKLMNDTVILPSLIGRINNTSCSIMPLELLREFVSRCQSIHPAVNTYIQANIGKFPYFQQISESTCGFGQIVLGKTQVDLIKRPNSNGITKMDTSYRIKRIVDQNVFETLRPVVDDTENFADVLFIRAMGVENNMSLLHQDYSNERPIPHGHNFTMDVFDASRSKRAVKPSVEEAIKKFGPALQLCNWAFPVDYQIDKKPQWYTLATETGTYIADELNRPVMRDVKIPIASDEDKTALV